MAKNEDRDFLAEANREIAEMRAQERVYVERIRFLRTKKSYKQHLNWSAFLDWLAVFTGVTSFVFIVLWAAAPDSQQISLDMAIARAFSYGFPITVGMWGVSRATRKNSYVPKGMAEALPYARFNKDGKIESTTVGDDEQGNPPHPIGDQGSTQPKGDPE